MYHSLYESQRAYGRDVRTLCRLSLLGLACALASCGLWSSKQHVALIGDSILAISANQVNSAIAPSYDYSEQFVSGGTIGAQLPAIERTMTSEHPDDWVLELGTNDAGSYQSPTWLQEFANEMKAVQGARCVVLVTLSPLLSSRGPVYGALNQAMAKEAAAHRTVHLLDWGHIEYQKPGWVRDDGIHPTPAGSTELAALTKQALDACPTGTVPSPLQGAG